MCKELWLCHLLVNSHYGYCIVTSLWNNQNCTLHFSEMCSVPSIYKVVGNQKWTEWQITLNITWFNAQMYPTNIRYLPWGTNFFPFWSRTRHFRNTGFSKNANALNEFEWKFITPMWPIYTKQSPSPWPKFCSVSLDSQPFSRYKGLLKIGNATNDIRLTGNNNWSNVPCV